MKNISCKRWISAFLVSFGCFVLIACKEFIEPSLVESKITLLAPADRYESNKYTQSFWWEPVEDAINYRLQIVQPAFDSIGSLVLDTLIRSDKFIYTLDPGRYEWRVRAENGSSQTLYAKRSFTIHLSSIRNQQVQVLSPLNNSVTGQAEMTYKWAGIYGATRYRFQLDTNSFSNDSILVFNRTTPATEFTVPFDGENNYQWRVRAENDTTESRWSPVQNVKFDKTPPAKVTLLSPSNNGTSTKPVSLTWTSAAEAKKYELTVYKNDGSTLYSSAYPMVVNTTTYIFNNGEPGEVIYWKVRAADGAGNWGTYSDLRSFTIQ